MPVYVSVASSYCKVGELAGTRRKRTEGAGRYESIGEPTMVGTGRGRKLEEETGSVKKYLATTKGK